MAQLPQQKSGESIEIDTSSIAGFQFKYTWSIRTEEEINAFVNCNADVSLKSPLVTYSFKLDQEEISLDWYIIACPNGTKALKDSTNLFMISDHIVELPPAKSIEITSLKISRVVSIPELQILEKSTYNFDNKPYLGYFAIADSHNINKDVFSKYNVAKRGGFDINYKISIKSITYKKIEKKHRSQLETGAGMVQRHLGGNSNSDVENNNQTNRILTVVENMQIQLNQVLLHLNDIKSNNNNPIFNSNNNQNKLEQWILNIFINGNEAIGKEYVKMIIENEGFDDIDVFCNLNEMDLKEIGINKKGHRMKLMQKIREYNGKKLQSLMVDKNMNAKVAPGAALDVQETEGKE